MASWWGAIVGARSSRTGYPRHLRLHVGYVLASQRYGGRAAEPAPLRQLMRHRGESWRLHLAAVYLAQLGASGNSRVDPQVPPQYHYFRDEVNDYGVLARPSWASLVVGFDGDLAPKEEKLRNDLVTRAFKRLENCELVERLAPARARKWRLLLDNRAWTTRTVDSRVYRVPRNARDFIDVPAEFFTRGWYLRFSPTACHYLLASAAAEKRNLRSASPRAVSRQSRLNGEKSLTDADDGEQAMELFRTHVHATNIREWDGERVSPPYRFENTMDWLLRTVASKRNTEPPLR